MKKSAPFYFFLLVVFFISACDQQQEVAPAAEEALPVSNAEHAKNKIYIFPGGEAVINLTDKLKLRANARVEIEQKPGRGELKFMEGELLRYIAFSDFKSGTDQFVLKTLQDSEVLDQDTIKVVMETESLNTPCWLGTFSDVFFIWKDSLLNNEVSLNVMENDIMCDSTTAKLGLFRMPTYGTARVSNNYVLYTPGPDFTGSDYFVYSLLEDPADGRSVTLGSVTISMVNEGGDPDNTGCTTPIQAMNDYLVISGDSISSDSTYTAVLNVLDNDSICGNVWMLGVHWYPFEAKHEVKNNVIYYTFPRNFSGLDSLGYTICDFDSLCDQGYVEIEVR